MNYRGEIYGYCIQSYVRVVARSFAFPLFSVKWKSMQSENKWTKWVERKKEKKIKNDKSLLYYLTLTIREICRHTNLRKSKTFYRVEKRREREKKKRKFERKCNRPKIVSSNVSRHQVFSVPNLFPRDWVANIDRKFITDRNHAATFYYLKFIDIPPEFHRVLQL